jgi:hypothetical protein
MLALRRFDQQIRAFVLLRARADSIRDGSKPQGLRHTTPCDGLRTVAFSPSVKMNDC